MTANRLAVLLTRDECPVCGRTPVLVGRKLRKHPCRFAVACSCWRGVPCDGSGRVKS